MDSSKRVTCLISTLAGGGAEGVCVNICSSLADRGGSIELLVLNLDNAINKRQLSGSVKLTSLGVQHARASFLPLLRHLNKTKPSTVIAFNYELMVVMVMLRPCLRFKFRLIARNINNLSKNTLREKISIKDLFVGFLTRKLYRYVDHIVNQCEGMRQDFIDVTDVSRDKTSVIYNPVNRCIEQLAEEQSQLKVAKENFILCVGRLEEQKAFHYAIAAFSLIVKDFRGLRLKFVGDGSLKPELQALAATLNVTDYVDFEGYSQDIGAYYQRARLTLLTSMYEGFPNVLVESITVGTPVVSFDCQSGPSEIVKDGVNGYLVRDFDAEKLAENISIALRLNWQERPILDSAKPYKSSDIADKWYELLYQNKIC
ncbi:glycosyltransferase [Rheinheimera sp. NSM]|uniref:glycosyltransferase n=1 Tax=Rheinheimera sp. NSM TaxID=3457884 RepID=UPI0040359F52